MGETNINSGNRKVIIDKLYPFIRKHLLLVIFFTLFLIYSSNLRVIGSGDTIPASLLPFGILDNHNLYFDSAYQYYVDNGVLTYFFWNLNGHWMSAYPIVTGVLITPLYIPAFIILKLINVPFDLSNPTFMYSVIFMEKLCSTIIASLAACAFFLAVKELLNEKVAFIGTFIFAIGTNTWMIGSQGLWQHGMGELLLCIILFLVFSFEKRPQTIHIVLIGLLSGLFFFNRPSDSLLLIPVTVYILLKGYKPTALFLAAIAFVALPFVAYNLYFFNSLFGGYGQLSSKFSINTLPEGLLGVLINPSRGLIIYMPIVLLAIPGFLKIRSVKSSSLRTLLYLYGLAIAAEVLMYGMFGEWWGGACWGARLLTILIPVLIIFVSLYLVESPLTRPFASLTSLDRIVLIVVITLVLLSVMIQVIGAYCYTNGGWTWDRDVFVLKQKSIWDCSDTQILRSVSAGPGDFRVDHLLAVIKNQIFASSDR